MSTTVSAGLETPDMIELRKRKNQIESDMESGGTETPALYKILPEKATSVGGSMMGSSKVYDVSSAAKKHTPQDQLTSGIASTGIDLALNPDELEISSNALQSRYDQITQNYVNDNDAEFDEDFLKQNKKRKKVDNKAGVSNTTTSSSANDKEKNKKYKDFKF
jgi:hypothetical protein